MRLQRSFECKSLPAYVATKRFVSRMRQYMSLEMRSSPKALPTKLTAESFDSRVKLLVGFEGVGVYEGFSAVLASKGLFTCVKPFMRL